MFICVCSVSVFCCWLVDCLFVCVLFENSSIAGTQRSKEYEIYGPKARVDDGYWKDYARMLHA